MKNTHMNEYIIDTIRKRAIIYLIRNFKSSYTNDKSIYNYVYQNHIYAISRQYFVIKRAYKLPDGIYNRSAINGLYYPVFNKTIDLLHGFYNAGRPINFDTI